MSDKTKPVSENQMYLIEAVQASRLLKDTDHQNPLYESRFNDFTIKSRLAIRYHGEELLAEIQAKLAPSPSAEPPAALIEPDLPEDECTTADMLRKVANHIKDGTLKIDPPDRLNKQEWIDGLRNRADVLDRRIRERLVASRATDGSSYPQQRPTPQGNLTMYRPDDKTILTAVEHGVAPSRKLNAQEQALWDEAQECVIGIVRGALLRPTKQPTMTLVEIATVRCIRAIYAELSTDCLTREQKHEVMRAVAQQLNWADH